MATTTKERKATKTVQIIARVQFKADARKVVYLVRGSQGEEYQTFLFDGKATSCTCAARKPCYHMTQCEAKEADRVETAEVVALAEEYVREEIDEEAKTQDWMNELAPTTSQSDEAYDAWKAEHNLHNTLSREAYVACFDPCGLEVM